MPQKAWHLDRRTFLQGAGASLALPLLDAMSSANPGSQRELPRRMCFFYFPFGVVHPRETEPRSWRWFPIENGESPFTLSDVHAPLAPLRNELTLFNGLSHPYGRGLFGHHGADVFLTAGGYVRPGAFQNFVSVDQVAAQHLGAETRYSSLVLSPDGGVGDLPGTSTLSYNREGRPIPAQSNPRQIFRMLFGVDDNIDTARGQLHRSASMLDLIREDSRDLQRRLGQHDQRKMDEYLDSVRSVEQQVQQAERWLNIPKPRVNEDSLTLEATPNEPRNFIRTMYDLIFLAFRTDSTRLATHMMANQRPECIGNSFPMHLGMGKTWHDLGHSGSNGGGGSEGREKLMQFQRFLSEQLCYFLDRLKSTPEGDGNLLDRTVVLYGGTNDHTHSSSNFPLLLAGGRRLGFKHNQYLNFASRNGNRAAPPLANLFLTMLHRMNVPAERFGDSTGEMTEVLS